MIHALDPKNIDITLDAVHHKSDTKIPFPYRISNGKQALLIVGNPENFNIEVELNISRKYLGFNSSNSKLKITEFWPLENLSQLISNDEFLKNNCIVPGVKKSGRGL